MSFTSSAITHEQGANASDPAAYVEPWMRGTHKELDPLCRAVVHALEFTLEDADRHLGSLSTEQIHNRPEGLPSVAFHLRHIARSLDRLLTYADGRPLNDLQLRALSTEHDTGTSVDAVRTEFIEGVAAAINRIKAVPPEAYPEARGIGRKQLPTTVAGLLVHCAEHTQRHTGQAITTSRLVQRPEAEGTA